MIPARRVNLWAIEPGDLSTNYIWANDPEIVKLMGFSAVPRSGWNIHGWLEEVNRNPKSQYLAIKLNDGTYIGIISLMNIEWEQASAETGLFIGDRRYRHQGYGKEAMLAMLRYAYEELRLHRVFARIIAYNRDSINFFEGLGFVREGIQREAFYTWGRFWDIAVYSMLADEFHKIYPYKPEDSVSDSEFGGQKSE